MIVPGFADCLPPAGWTADTPTFALAPQVYGVQGVQPATPARRSGDPLVLLPEGSHAPWCADTRHTAFSAQRSGSFTFAG